MRKVYLDTSKNCAMKYFRFIFNEYFSNPEKSPMELAEYPLGEPGRNYKIKLEKTLKRNSFIRIFMQGAVKKEQINNKING